MTRALPFAPTLLVGVLSSLETGMYSTLSPAILPVPFTILQLKTPHELSHRDLLQQNHSSHTLQTKYKAQCPPSSTPTHMFSGSLPLPSLPDFSPHSSIAITKRITHSVRTETCIHASPIVNLQCWSPRWFLWSLLAKAQQAFLFSYHSA
jgi:hypothetical protein